ncbi:acyl-CoA thioesterase II [Speluncibacter jeojiensis]|uniref:Acyl-CoA thioesterase 2 n=1 Tax=Speluncibacter jeojiensis TaxID=2710754 RepID=A0A9X4M4E8_9ACTN|nr:acyl-CoA thioesterase II [Corynebacteriales bacterium D3-21]
MTSIEEILELEQLERDIFRGAVVETMLTRTFGGQVAGQALVSAVRTVEPEFRVHSLHGYFLRPGNPTIPTVFLVDRVKEGRSFHARRVNGVQNGETIFSMSASFHHVGEVGVEHQDTMPPAPAPEELPDPTLGADEKAMWFGREWAKWDVRIVPDDQTQRIRGLAAQQRVWFRYREPLPDDQVFHICTLAYMSDMTLLSAAKVPHRGAITQNASLDHALWFLRPFRADDWLLYDQTSPSAEFGRALTQGRIYDRAGRMVAAVVQEGLMRLTADETKANPL